MNNNSQLKSYLSVFIGTTFLIISIGLSWLFFNINSHAHSSISLPEVYYNALKDVKEVRPEEISNNLIAIVKNNSQLQWRGDRLKVATFAKAKYDYEVGSREPQQRDMWVTVVPELKNFCTNYSAATGKEVTPRIEQLLGLPPGNNEPRKIVEFWVEAKDLFRPTPDPEITDREAELEFRPANEFSSVSDKYKDWYNHELNSFKSRIEEMNPDKMPVPWTRLGYTYDWGDSSDHVGLSEFVLAKGSSLEVDAVTPVDDYCQGDDAIAVMNLTK
ncbi:MAG: hypothetical protein QNJ72_44095 [Pleurocapsa sp. MO_226.B13]|nr:hypothetical protein [Pleurocapsa sp. MO_226.B13]